MRTLVRLVVALVVATSLAGCSFVSNQLQKDHYPTEDLKAEALYEVLDRMPEVDRDYMCDAWDHAPQQVYDVFVDTLEDRDNAPSILTFTSVLTRVCGPAVFE